jgi:hypothetical protein
MARLWDRDEGAEFFPKRPAPPQPTRWAHVHQLAEAHGIRVREGVAAFTAGRDTLLHPEAKRFKAPRVIGIGHALP